MANKVLANFRKLNISTNKTDQHDILKVKVNKVPTMLRKMTTPWESKLKV